MASTISKKRVRKAPATRRVTVDETKLKELVKEAVLEALAERELEVEDAWDRQMREDVDAGRWDRRLEEARKEFREGKTAPLVFENGKLK